MSSKESSVEDETKSAPQPASSGDELSKAMGRKPRSAPDETVSWSMKVAASWSWRIAVVAAALYVLFLIAGKLEKVIIPILISLLFTAVLMPMVRFMVNKLRFPRALAASVAMLIGLGVAGTVLAFSISQIVTAAPDMATSAASAFERLTAWLSNGPLNLREAQISRWIAQGTQQLEYTIKSNVSLIANGAFVYAVSAAEVGATAITVLFCLFFFLKDGKQIWWWCVRLLPRNARRPFNESICEGWSAVGKWARVQVLVAAIDAVGIGTGAFFIGTSLWIPIALLTFLMTFIPILGAFIAGAVAVLVVFVDVSPTAALIMIIVVLVVQQLEGNVLQPFLMSSAVALHPVAVVLGVAAGGYLYGILGALLAVPVMAFINDSIQYLNSGKAYENHSETTDVDLGLIATPEQTKE